MENTLKQTENETYSKNDLARIQYQCRRGMLELDVFLMPFCANCFTTLSTSEQSCFIELLTEPDPDLFSWLMGYGESSQHYKKLIEQIRKYQLSRE